MNQDSQTTPSQPAAAAPALKGQAGFTIMEMMVVLAIIALVMGLIVGPRVMKALRGSENQTALIMCKDFATQAFTQWHVANPGKQCPGSLKDLVDYSSSGKTKDPWGGELVMVCGDGAPAGVPNRFGVTSLGKDGKQGTEDDIKSWEEAK